MWASGAYGYLSDYLLWYFVLGTLVIHSWCFFRFTRNWQRRKLKLIVGNALIALILLVFAGLVAETYLRFVSVDTDAFGATLTCQRWQKAYAQVNSQYFRDPEWTEEKPLGVMRIAFLGDSFVYGWGIKDENDRFTNLLQRRFDEHRPGAVRVMNFGWANWDTRAELHALTTVLPDYHVDEIVLCYLPNDIAPLVPALAHENPRDALSDHYLNTESSFLVNYLYYRILARRFALATDYWDALANGYANPKIWTEHAADLDRMITFCKMQGIRFRVVLFPLLMTNGSKYKARDIHEKLAEFFALRKVETVDLLSVVENHDAKSLIVNNHDAHPNELANRFFAEAIWKAFYFPKHEAPGSHTP